MEQRIPRALSAIATALVASVGWAQCPGCPGTARDVRIARVLLNGSGETVLDCQDASTDFPFDLGNYSGWDSSQIAQDWVLHIYSCSGADVGHVTIAGNPQVGSPPHDAIRSLAVYVGAQTQAWNENPGDPLSEGCADFGGLDVSNSAMRAKTRASIAVSNNIRNHPAAAGNIHVNQIVRVQAHGHGNPVTGGVIDGTITADGSGTLFDGATDAIGQVRAWDSILRDVVASDKNIAAVKVVGDSTVTPGPGGIQGNISAANGSIDQIWTSGPIGASNNHVSITAGKRIGLITAHDDGVSGDDAVLGKNFFVNIEASALGVPDPSGSTSSFSLIETEGDYVGTIHLWDFYGGTQQYQRQGSSGPNARSGIFIGGKLVGDIVVEGDYYLGDIIARSIRADAEHGYGGTVTIGRLFEGCLVAMGYDTEDTLDGTIVSVSIGNNGATVGPDENKHGFSGRAGEPIMAAPFEGDEANRRRWFTEPAPSGAPPLDGVIRAEREIGTVDLYAMSNRLSHLGRKNCRPRVESPRIDSLTIRTAMDAGVVWSGVLNNMAYHTDQNDINDDYASIGTMSIGCVGPVADLWVMDCPSVDIHGDMFGEIHVPELASNQRLRIHDRFGDIGQVGSGATSCDGELDGYDIGDIYHSPVIGVLPEENSPRGYWFDEDLSYGGLDGVAAYSRIRVQAVEGLHGQVVLNANGTGGPASGDEADYWRGDVEVGTGDPHATPTRPPPEVYSTLGRETTADRAGPYYAQHSVTDGGGSIGLVRYHLHGEDCNPEQDSSVCWMPTGSWPGYGTREIAKGALYGKMIDTVTGDSDPPVVVKRQSLICSTCPSPWEDVTSTCLVLSGQGSNGREFWVAFNNGVHAFPDMYNWSIAARIDEDHVADLKCGDTFSTAPDVNKFEYKFTLSSLPCWELPTFSEEDPAAWADGNGYYTIESWEILVQVDLNRDGVLDEQDLLDLLHRLDLD